jgi:RNA polymerase sigma factor (TIGR02999 family)
LSDSLIIRNRDQVPGRTAEELKSQSAEELLPLVYDELRKVAHWRMTRERPGQTLQATALVHEAYIRVAGGKNESEWGDRRHFFAAASEAMRRILIENARRKNAQKRGGGAHHTELAESHIAAPSPPEELLAMNEALEKLAAADAPSAELVKLRYFVGLTQTEVAEILGMSRRDADRLWAFARAWLRTEMEKG